MLDSAIEWIRGFPSRPINESLPPSLLLYLIPPAPSPRTLAAVFTVLTLVAVRVFFILPSNHESVLLPPKPSRAAPSTDASRKLKVALFLGSGEIPIPLPVWLSRCHCSWKASVARFAGGHTTELLQLASALPPERYAERLYLYSSGDRFSLDKARELEQKLLGSKVEAVQALEIPRARAVHQSWLSTPLSLAYSFAFCLEHMVRRPLASRLTGGPCSWSGSGSGAPAFADLVLLNGPGTCVPIVGAIYVLKVCTRALRRSSLHVLADDHDILTEQLFGFPAPKLVYIESFARVKSLSLTAKLLKPLVDRFVVQWPPAAGTLGGRIVYNGWLV